MRFFAANLWCGDLDQNGNPRVAINEGFGISKSPYPHLLVGDGGNPSRAWTRVALGKGVQNYLKASGSFTLSRGSFIRTKEKNTLLLVEDRKSPDENEAAAILFRASVRDGVTAIYAPERQTLAKGEHWVSPTGANGISATALILTMPGETFYVRHYCRETDKMQAFKLFYTGSLTAKVVTDEKEIPGIGFAGKNMMSKGNAAKTVRQIDLDE